MRSRGALRLALACCAAFAASAAVVVATPPPAGNATAPAAKPPAFDVQEVSTQLFLDIAGARCLPPEGFRAPTAGRYNTPLTSPLALCGCSHHAGLPLCRPRV